MFFALSLRRWTGTLNTLEQINGGRHTQISHLSRPVGAAFFLACKQVALQTAISRFSSGR